MSETTFKISKPRFAKRELHFNSNAQVRHFVPISEVGGVQRDRFGNRIFTSTFTLPPKPSEVDIKMYRNSNKAYHDREGLETRASLLVTPQGEQFIRNNSGILGDIDRGLIELASFPAFLSEEINLSPTRKFKKLSSGSQSQTFLLEVGTKKYVIKIQAPSNPYEEALSQPYINELLQTQALATDLAPDLATTGIEMPTFLFASGQVSCVEFVKGKHPQEEKLTEKLTQHIQGSNGQTSLLAVIKQYISEQNSELWKNIKQDATKELGALKEIVRRNNFIQRSDGTIVWIDPFFYKPPAHTF